MSGFFQQIIISQFIFMCQIYNVWFDTDFIWGLHFFLHRTAVNLATLVWSLDHETDDL